jgi:hypothetical protein
MNATCSHRVDKDGNARDRLEEWQVAWVRAVAKVWEEQAKNQTTFRELLKRNPQAALSQVVPGFELPKGVELRVVDDVNDIAKGSPPLLNRQPLKAKVGFDAHARKWVLPDTVLIALIPPKPDDKDQAVALGEYLDPSDTFPFTTC